MPRPPTPLIAAGLSAALAFGAVFGAGTLLRAGDDSHGHHHSTDQTLPPDSVPTTSILGGPDGSTTVPSGAGGGSTDPGGGGGGDGGGGGATSTTLPGEQYDSRAPSSVPESGAVAQLPTDSPVVPPGAKFEYATTEANGRSWLYSISGTTAENCDRARSAVRDAGFTVGFPDQCPSGEVGYFSFSGKGLSGAALASRGSIQISLITS